MVAGHTHTVMFRRVPSHAPHGTLIVNPGSLSYGRGRDAIVGRATYSLLDRSAATGWQATLREVRYDPGPMHAALLALRGDYPVAAYIANRLRPPDAEPVPEQRLDFIRFRWGDTPAWWSSAVICPHGVRCAANSLTSVIARWDAPWRVMVIARGRTFGEAISNFAGEIASHKALAMTYHRQVGCAPAVTVIARGRSPETISYFGRGDCFAQTARNDIPRQMRYEKTAEQARVLCLPCEQHCTICTDSVCTYILISSCGTHGLCAHTSYRMGAHDDCVRRQEHCL